MRTESTYNKNNRLEQKKMNLYTSNSELVYKCIGGACPL